MTPLTKMKLTEADLCTPEATKVEVDEDFLVLEHSASRVEMFETDMYEDTDKEEEKKELFRPSPMKLPSAQPKSASAASRKQIKLLLSHFNLQCINDIVRVKKPSPASLLIG